MGSGRREEAVDETEAVLVGGKPREGIFPLAVLSVTFLPLSEDRAVD
jgi:hypothetical protein